MGFDYTQKGGQGGHAFSYHFGDLDIMPKTTRFPITRFPLVATSGAVDESLAFSFPLCEPSIEDWTHALSLTHLRAAAKEVIQTFEQ